MMKVGLLLSIGALAASAAPTWSVREQQLWDTHVGAFQEAAPLDFGNPKIPEPLRRTRTRPPHFHSIFVGSGQFSTAVLPRPRPMKPTKPPKTPPLKMVRGRALRHGLARRYAGRRYDGFGSFNDDRYTDSPIWRYAARRPVYRRDPRRYMTYWGPYRRDRPHWHTIHSGYHKPAGRRRFTVNSGYHNLPGAGSVMLPRRSLPQFSKPFGYQRPLPMGPPLEAPLRMIPIRNIHHPTTAVEDDNPTVGG